MRTIWFVRAALVGRPASGSLAAGPACYRRSVTVCNQLFTHCNRVQAEIASILAFEVDRSVSQGDHRSGGTTVFTRERRVRRRGGFGPGPSSSSPSSVAAVLPDLLGHERCYGANAGVCNTPADIGTATIAAEGNYDNTAANDGLNSTPLVQVTQVDNKENVVGGVFSDAYTCGTRATLCENSYTATGTVIGTVEWNPAVAT